MALPKIETPIYELTLPLSRKTITFRPFLVKEQKILLMASESEEKDSILMAVKQILQNCTLTDLKIDTLPIIDIEYYFLNLRARSVGEIAEVRYKCTNVVDDQECGNNLDVSFNLLDLNIVNTDKYDDVIMLTDKVGVKFKYPDYSTVVKVSNSENISEMALDVMFNSVEYIFEGDKFYMANETPKEEMVEFFESLSQQQFEKIEDYFSNLPVLNKEQTVKCSKCGYEHVIMLEGIESFFQ